MDLPTNFKSPPRAEKDLVEIFGHVGSSLACRKVAFRSAYKTLHCVARISLDYLNNRAAAGSVEHEATLVSRDNQGEILPRLSRYNLSLLLEVHGAEISQGRMPARGIVEALDIIEHVGPCLVARAVGFPRDPFGLQ
jgi:hypothetical protein